MPVSLPSRDCCICSWPSTCSLWHCLCTATILSSQWLSGLVRRLSKPSRISARTPANLASRISSRRMEGWSRDGPPLAASISLLSWPSCPRTIPKEEDQGRREDEAWFNHPHLALTISPHWSHSGFYTFFIQNILLNILFTDYNLKGYFNFHITILIQVHWQNSINNQG